MNKKSQSLSLILFVSFVIIALLILLFTEGPEPNTYQSAQSPKKPIDQVTYAVKFLQDGESPYDAIFGEGLYHNTQNSILVKASDSSDVVFILIDVVSGKRIRNEFINRGSTFELTKIPYGTYDYMYFSGINWSDEIDLGIGVKGGFTKNGSFSKNSYSSDRIEFEQGYYGSYEITLYSVSNGNLETTKTSAEDFFN